MRTIRIVLGLLCAAAWVGMNTGCTEGFSVRPKGDSTAITAVPAPLDMLLPHEMEIHPFTAIETFQDGQSGIHARVKMLDAFGHPVKAFGNFRFDLYAYVPNQTNNRGSKIAQWPGTVANAENNLLHWDQNYNCYEFKLGWNRQVPTGKRLLFVATFESRFTPRLTAESEIVAGE